MSVPLAPLPAWAAPLRAAVAAMDVEAVRAACVALPIAPEVCDELRGVIVSGTLFEMDSDNRATEAAADVYVLLLEAWQKNVACLFIEKLPEYRDRKVIMSHRAMSNEEPTCLDVDMHVAPTEQLKGEINEIKTDVRRQTIMAAIGGMAVNKYVTGAANGEGVYLYKLLLPERTCYEELIIKAGGEVVVIVGLKEELDEKRKRVARDAMAELDERRLSLSTDAYLVWSNAFGGLHCGWQ